MTDTLTTPTILSEHTLLRAGCPLHYWVGGQADRPLIACLHGATMDHRMFNAQVEALAPHYRVLTWDARGHGQSQPIGADFSLTRCAEDLLAILDAEGVDQAILCGQSLGGYIAQHIYRLAPERVRALIIIGSTPITKAYSRWEIWALKASLPLFRLWPYGHFTQTIARIHGRRPEVQAYMLQAARQIPMKMADWVAKLDAFLQFNGRDLLTNAGGMQAAVAKRLDRHADPNRDRICLVGLAQMPELAATLGLLLGVGQHGLQIHH